MNNNLPTKELVIAIVERDDVVLMRQKPEGSSPYKETWYSFGCDRIPNQDDRTNIKNYLKDTIGIDVEVDNQSITPAFEIKEDHDGVEKNFIYINLICKYLSGIPKVPQGAIRVEWIPKDKLSEYDIVPPSVKLLKDLGYKI